MVVWRPRIISRVVVVSAEHQLAGVGLAAEHQLPPGALAAEHYFSSLFLVQLFSIRNSLHLASPQ